MIFNFINKIKNKNDNTGYRYERKFAVSGISVEGIESIIKNNEAFFKEIFYERYVNNIYFDTQNLTFYNDNVSGKSQRKKYRIRWYGKLSGLIRNPVLEIKIKNGEAGTKKSYPLREFYFKDKINLKEISETCFNASELPDEVREAVKNLFPVLINRYKRKYFLDFSGKYRITLDSETEYFNISGGKAVLSNKATGEGYPIVELKYNIEDNKGASDISSLFPFRMTKNSKYVNGISVFYGAG